MLIITAIACPIFLLNLGNGYLWQDEAQTALISKTVLTSNFPLGTDGKNYFSQEHGSEYGENYIWKWHTWLQFYLVAASFRTFGTNTFAARFPFAIFGIAIIPLLYFFVIEITKDKKTAIATILLVLLCIPFIILSRQCRYYSIVTFFSLLSLYAYLLIVNKKRFSFVLFIIAFNLLFHSFIIYVPAVIIAILIHTLLFYRQELRRVLIACIIAILPVIPWVIWLSTMNYGKGNGLHVFEPINIIKSIIVNIKMLGYYVLPWYLVIPVIGLFIYLYKKQNLGKFIKKIIISLSLPLLFISLTIVLLSVFAPFPFFRYLSPVIPLILIIGGLIIVEAYKIRPYFAFIMFFLTIAIQPIYDYGYELTHVYKGPIEGIVTFLNENSHKDDIVAITYGDMPLKFYTSLRIVGGLTGEDLSICKKAKWVIIRKNIISTGDKAVQDYLYKNLELKNYHKIGIDYPDIPFENRESPNEHQYRTVKNAQQVIIYEKN